MSFTFKSITVPTAAEVEEFSTIQDSFFAQKEAIDREFDTFVANAKKLIKEVEKMLQTPYENNPAQLEEDMQQYISYGVTVGQFIADAISFLTIYQALHFCPKSEKHKSESDRKQYVEVKTILQRNLCDYLKVLDDKLDKKISVGQSILKFESNKIG